MHPLLLTALWTAHAAPPPTLVLGDPTPTGVLAWAELPAGHTACGWVDGRLHRQETVPETGTITLHLDGLTPGAPARIAVTAAVGTDCGAPPEQARVLQVPPEPTTAAPFRLAWGGDLTGQNVCRHETEGFPAVSALAERPMDLFIALGDFIYADGTCEPVGRYQQPQLAGDFPIATELEHFLADWRYTLSDPAVARLRSAVPVVTVWDDHEVVNDFGGSHPLAAPGLAAYRAMNPLPDPLYRSLRYGAHLELLVLDTRSYRGPNTHPDTEADPGTLLGDAQRTWLVDRLQHSDATWLVVVSSVPIGVPTGWPPGTGRDGWADNGEPTGHERELAQIFAAAGPRSMLWLSTDVHFATVVRYQPNDDQTIIEAITGPLSAGIFPNPTLDPTFSPEALFYWAPEGGADAPTWKAARHFFNWGELEIAEDGAARLSVRTLDGEVYGLALPRPGTPAPL